VSRYLYIAVLVIAGEMVFGLPFHTARYFRPTLLEVFGFTNTQLGDLFALYGVAAMLGYFPGGALADRFSARNLLTASLLTTALGGLYMATIPGPTGMGVLYAYWGITTIFLFWGALIRATREWGGETSQGAAFGVLEAGRGLVAALIGSGLVWVLASYMPGDAAAATDAERITGFRMVILGYALVSLGAGALTWLVIPDNGAADAPRRNSLPNMLFVASKPVIWAQAGIIVAAYCAFKSADYYGLYLVQVLGKDEVEGARLATLGSYIRPIAALATGLIADRLSASRAIGTLFLLMAGVYAALSVASPETTDYRIIYANLLTSVFAIFALRGVYFALLEETHTPARVTGAAVGLVSVVGFTPEIFVAPIAGRILDATPGVGGFQHLFILLAGVSAAGLAIVVWLTRLQRSRPAR
jgi:predicted MFS family arabinose efflux permease